MATPIKAKIAAEVALTKLRLAAVERVLAQKEESAARKFSTVVEAARKVIPAIGLCYGTLLTFLYLFFVAHFFPSGLNLGDSLFLLFIAFGYGLFSFMFSGVGLLVVYPASTFHSSAWTVDPKNAAAPAIVSTLFGLSGAVLPTLLATLTSWLFRIETIFRWVDENSWIYFVILLTLLCLSFFLTYFANSRGARVAKNTSSPSLPDKSNAWMGDAFMYFLGSAIAFFSVLLFQDTGVLFVGTATVAGLSLFFSFTSFDSPKEVNSQDRSRILVVPLLLLSIASLLPIFWDSYRGNFQITRGIFNSMGLSVPNTSVRLSGTSRDIVEEAAMNRNFNLSICPSKDNSALIAPLNVLWHGVGTRSLLSLPGISGERLEVNADEVKIVTNSKVLCNELKTQIYFALGSKIPAQPEQMKQLKEELARYLATSPAGQIKILEKISFTGYADPLPLGESGNEELALGRAKTVLHEIETDPDYLARKFSEGTIFNALSEGSRSSLSKQCIATSDRHILAECHAINRRVTVRLIVTEFKLNKKPLDERRK